MMMKMMMRVGERERRVSTTTTETKRSLGRRGGKGWRERAALEGGREGGTMSIVWERCGVSFCCLL